MSMIITDYWMPEMTGYELLKKVKVRARMVQPHFCSSNFRQKQHIIDADHSTEWHFCMQESSRLKEIPVVIMSSENVPTRINRLGSFPCMPKH